MGKESHLKIDIVPESTEEPPSLYGRLMASRATATSLEFQYLPRSKFDWITIKTVCDMMGTLPLLEKIRISGKTLPQEYLWRILGQATGLKELDLERLEMSGPSSEIDNPFLQNNPHLEKIQVRHVFGWKMDFQFFAQITVPNLPVLKEFYWEVSPNEAQLTGTSPDFLRWICQSKTLKKLTFIDRANKNVDTLVILKMVQYLLAAAGSSDVSGDAAAAAAAALTSTSSLEEINLDTERDAWNLDCIYALAELLLVNKSLKALRLSMHDDFTPPVLQSLHSNTTLQVFSTRYDQVIDNQYQAQIKDPKPQQEQRDGDEHMGDANERDHNNEESGEGPDTSNTNAAKDIRPTELQKAFGLMLKHNVNLTGLDCNQTFTPEMTMYLSLNKAGRKQLIHSGAAGQPATREDWLWGIMEFSHDENVVFYLLSHNPSLIAELGCPGRQLDRTSCPSPAMAGGKRKIKNLLATSAVAEVQAEYEERILQLQQLHIAELSEKDQQLTSKEAQIKQLVQDVNIGLRSIDGHAKRLRVSPEDNPNMQQLQSLLQSLMQQTAVFPTSTSQQDNDKKRLSSVLMDVAVPQKKGRTSPERLDSTSSSDVSSGSAASPNGAGGYCVLQ